MCKTTSWATPSRTFSTVTSFSAANEAAVAAMLSALLARCHSNRGAQARRSTKKRAEARFFVLR
jgi:hypothetical protein